MKDCFTVDLQSVRFFLVSWSSPFPPLPHRRSRFGGDTKPDVWGREGVESDGDTVEDET